MAFHSPARASAAASTRYPASPNARSRNSRMAVSSSITSNLIEKLSAPNMQPARSCFADGPARNHCGNMDRAKDAARMAHAGESYLKSSPDGKGDCDETEWDDEDGDLTARIYFQNRAHACRNRAGLVSR